MKNHNIAEQKQALKDLENARIATLNVLEDLQAEKEALGSAKAKDEALLASISDGIIATDPNRRIIVMNKMAEKMLGWKIDEALGKPYDDIVLLEDEKGTSARATTAATTELYLLNKNKIKFPVAVTVSPIILSDKIIGAVEVFRDITKEKEIEKLRVDFLSLASHQLRTPLSGTKWLIETMQKGITGKIEKKEKEYLDQIYQINERMIQLVSEMLGVLRLESEAGSVKKEKILISDIYKDIPVSMAAAAKSREIILHNNLKRHKSVAIETNQEILKNILECFISNAVNYSQNGQKMILDIEEKPKAVVFFVKDNGIGIPKEEQKKIFERFYRASNAKNFKPAGSGLGLSIAKILAEKIGAKVSFESPASPAKRGEKEDKGTIFYLSIPKIKHL